MKATDLYPPTTLPFSAVISAFEHSSDTGDIPCDSFTRFARESFKELAILNQNMKKCQELAENCQDSRHVEIRRRQVDGFRQNISGQEAEIKWRLGKLLGREADQVENEFWTLKLIQLK